MEEIKKQREKEEKEKQEAEKIKREEENRRKREEEQRQNRQKTGQNNVDYYEVLGVSRDATRKEIDVAYKRMALVTHPDLNSGHENEATERFKKIREAYEILTGK
mgnify:FL=1